MNEAYENQNRRRNNRRFWRALGASLATATIVSLSVLMVMNEGDRQRLLAENEALTSQVTETKESLDTFTVDVASLTAENLTLTLKVAEQEKVLTSREGFFDAVDAAAALIERSAGLVDTREFRELLTAQQEVVFEERRFANNVDAATATITAATSEMEKLLDARLREVAPRGISPGIRVEDKTPFDTARRALDDVGGAWVGLYTADIVCDQATAIACSSSDGHITIANRVMGNGYEFLYQTMMHEYAHQIQFRSLDTMYASPRYQALFGGFGSKAAIEAAADCMAAARTTMDLVGYGFGCTPEQLAWGRDAWDGVW